MVFVAECFRQTLFQQVCCKFQANLFLGTPLYRKFSTSLSEPYQQFELDSKSCATLKEKWNQSVPKRSYRRMAILSEKQTGANLDSMEIPGLIESQYFLVIILNNVCQVINQIHHHLNHYLGHLNHRLNLHHHYFHLETYWPFSLLCIKTQWFEQHYGARIILMTT